MKDISLYSLSRAASLAVLLSLSITACGGGGSSSGSTPPPDDGGTTPPPANNAPVADAGSDSSVDEFEGIALTGAGSDPDGDALAFEWTVPNGFAHNGVDSKTLEIVNTPTVMQDEDFTFTLTVTDSGGASHSDETILTVLNNQSPTASIGDSPRRRSRDDRRRKLGRRIDWFRIERQ